uniref:Reverse transcriptase Ty1/copia-type domain-containing protein n=1 Tax=Strongyloides papillosus TaxID=174720 RepID=A0A0N5BE83_STREA
MGCFQPDIPKEFSYAATANFLSFRYLLTRIVNFNLFTAQIDIKNAFLNGKLTDDEIYVMAPPGFPNYINKHQILKLQKSLYGLKQSAKIWQDTLTNNIKQLNFHQTEMDYCLFQRGSEYILVHVDDMIIAATSKENIQNIIDHMSKDFEVKQIKNDISNTTFNGIQIVRNENSILIHQRDKIECLRKYIDPKMRKPQIPFSDTKDPNGEIPIDDNLKREYRSVLGQILYISQCTRPDLAYSVSTLASRTEKATMNDYTTLLRSVYYLLETQDKSLIFTRETNDKITIYTDSSYADTTDYKSSYGYFIYLGENIIHWKSKKTKTIMTSTYEAELNALLNSLRSLLCLKKIMPINDTTIKCDNQPVLDSIKTSSINDRSKHLQISFLKIKE